MTGPTHALIGLASTVVALRVTGVEFGALELLAVLLGSLAPDVDGDGSITKPGRLFEALLGWRVANALDVYFVALSKVVNALFSHRGFIHSPLVPLILFSLAWWFGLGFLFWFAFGYASHLLGDLFTHGGIPVLSPLREERFSGSGLRTGSRGEAALAVGLVVVVCVLGWPLLPDGVKDTHRELAELLTD